jgi:toxin ParE1/3/4
VTLISVRARADTDIDTAIRYLMDHEPSTAARFIDELEATFRRISRNPGIGSPRYAELTDIDGLLSLAVKGFGYHVFYVVYDRSVAVVRVLHERRDVPSLLTDL